MQEIDWDKISFNYTKTNAVIVSHYKDGSWSPARKETSFNFGYNPFAEVFHYATSCFEGLKAFRGADGEVRLFRPDENAKRMKRSADFLDMPSPSEEMFIEMCVECVKENIDFLPPYGHGASMYIRPVLIGMNPQIALVPSNECDFAVMCSPVGSYSGNKGLKSVNAAISRNYDRAAPNGSGSYKVSANYPASFRPYRIAHSEGYKELLFLNPSTKRNIDEFGSSNFFAIKGNSFITPLSDSVLPSITNKSLQVVAGDMGLDVEKRVIPVEELDSVQEVAACGTAVVITPISYIDDKPTVEGKEVTKTYRFFPDGLVGPVSQKLYERILGYQFGEIADDHGWCLKI